jgi:hypothetical protein
MSKSIEFQDFRKSTSHPSRLAQMIDNPFRQFSASKMPIGRQKLTATVSFTDFMGKTHIVHCTNKAQIKKAKASFDEFRIESAQIQGIIAEYPVSFGRIPEKFRKELTKDLKTIFGLQKPLIDYIIQNHF